MNIGLVKRPIESAWTRPEKEHDTEAQKHSRETFGRRAATCPSFNEIMAMGSFNLGNSGIEKHSDKLNLQKFESSRTKQLRKLSGAIDRSSS